MTRVRMARNYDMRKRRRAAEQATAEIVAAAHRLLDRPDGGALTLEEVALEAGVSRSTVYNRIGRRAELLEAVFTDQGRLLGFDRVLAALALEDPLSAVEATVRESCRAWSVMPVAIRRTLALAVMDPEVRTLVERFERARRARLAPLATTLSAAGVLPPLVDRDGAHATLVLLTGFPAYDALAFDRPAAETEDLLVRMARTALGLGRG